MRRFPPILLLVLLAAALGACGDSGPATETVTVQATDGEATSTTAETTAAEDGAPTAAIETLLSEVTDPHGELQTQDFVTDEYVTADFRAAFDEEFADGQLDFDPFICAQQIPLKIDYVKESIEGTEARVTAALTYGGDEQQLQVYDMVDEDGAWKLDRTECLG